MTWICTYAALPPLASAAPLVLVARVRVRALFEYSNIHDAVKIPSMED